MNKRRNVYYRKDTMAKIPPKIFDSMIYNQDFDIREYEKELKEFEKWLESPVGKSWFYKFYYGLDFDIVRNIIEENNLVYQKNRRETI